MELLSDNDVLGLVNHLCSASTTPLSYKKQTKLYWLMSTAVRHLKTIKDDNRILNIRTNLLQNLAERDLNTLQQLSNWLREYSIKKTNGKFCGAIVPFEKLFCSITKPKETSQRQIQAFPPPFSIVNFIDNVRDTIPQNDHMEKTIHLILSLLRRWQNAAKENSEQINKKELIDDTKSLIGEIKKMEKDQFDILRFIISQKTKEFNNYLWNRITSSETKNFPLLSELIELIFDVDSLPEAYIHASCKSGVSSFFELIRCLPDLRKTQFVEAPVLKLLHALSSIDREHAINDSIDQINQGAFSNLSLDLHSIADLKAFFGENTYKKLSRLDFKNKSAQTLNQEENKKHTEHLLNTLSTDFPNLTHLSLDSYIFNPASEDHLRKFKKLQNLKLINCENSQQLDFLNALTTLQELQITTTHDVDLTNLLTLSKLKKLTIWVSTGDKLEIIKQITWLEDLTLTTSVIDISSLQDLKNLKHLKVNGPFKKLNLENLPLLLTLTIEDCPAINCLYLSELPLLKEISLKGSNALICELSGLPNLVELDLGSCNLNPADLNQSKLSRLTFRHPFLFSKNNWIFKHPIKSLNLSESKVCKLSRLDLLPNLTELNLTNCKKLSDTELNQVLNCPSLQTLFIDNRVLPQTFKKALKKKKIKLQIAK